MAYYMQLKKWPITTYMPYKLSPVDDKKGKKNSLIAQRQCMGFLCIQVELKPLMNNWYTNRIISGIFKLIINILVLFIFCSSFK